jgi:glycosyltransferase involved in cell wall biosynthesis
MFIGHFLPSLEGAGSEQILSSLLGTSTAEFKDQIVVSLADGAFRHVLEAAGGKVAVVGDAEAVLRELTRVDVVNCHLTNADGLPTVLQEAGRPTVITIHSAAALPPTSGTFSSALRLRVVTTSKRIHALQADGPYNPTLIPVGVDTRRFGTYTCPPGDDGAGPVLLRVAEPRRSSEVLWYVLAPLLVELPDLVLHLIGIDEMKATERVSAAGKYHDRALAMARATLLIHAPADAPEAPDNQALMVVLEAMASGLPSVVLGASDVREEIGDVPGVLWLPSEDIAGAQAAVRELVTSRDDAARLGGQARAYAREHLAMAARVPAFEALYREVYATGGALDV